MSTADVTRIVAFEHMVQLANFVAGEWRHEGEPLAECDLSRIVSIEGGVLSHEPVRAEMDITLPFSSWRPGRNRAERRASMRRRAA